MRASAGDMPVNRPPLGGFIAANSELFDEAIPEGSRACCVRDCEASHDGVHGPMCNRHRHLFARYGSVKDPTSSPARCLTRGDEFQLSRVGRKFCSDECRRGAQLSRRRAGGSRANQ